MIKRPLFTFLLILFALSTIYSSNKEVIEIRPTLTTTIGENATNLIRYTNGSIVKISYGSSFEEIKEAMVKAYIPHYEQAQSLVSLYAMKSEDNVILVNEDNYNQKNQEGKPYWTLANMHLNLFWNGRRYALEQEQDHYRLVYILSKNDDTDTCPESDDTQIPLPNGSTTHHHGEDSEGDKGIEGSGYEGPTIEIDTPEAGIHEGEEEQEIEEEREDQGGNEESLPEDTSALNAFSAFLKKQSKPLTVTLLITVGIAIVVGISFARKKRAGRGKKPSLPTAPQQKEDSPPHPSQDNSLTLSAEATVPKVIDATSRLKEKA